MSSGRFRDPLDRSSGLSARPGGPIERGQGKTGQGEQGATGGPQDDEGKGLAGDNKTKNESFMKMFEVQAGLGFGVKKFSLVGVFETPETFGTFVNSG